jgi:hypothetical protein
LSPLVRDETKSPVVVAEVRNTSLMRLHHVGHREHRIGRR